VVSVERFDVVGKVFSAFRALSLSTVEELLEYIKVASSRK